MPGESKESGRLVKGLTTRAGAWILSENGRIENHLQKMSLLRWQDDMEENTLAGLLPYLQQTYIKNARKILKYLFILETGFSG